LRSDCWTHILFVAGNHAGISDAYCPYPAAMRVDSPDSSYSQITSEMMDARVVIETVDATNISSQ
jgi:hypothetical protein